MSFHWSGPASIPGNMILVFAVAYMPILFTLVVFFAFYVFGSMIWDGVQAKRRLKPGQSPEQFLEAAEQLGAEHVRKAEEEWRLPPELDLPTPRPVRSAPLGTRLVRSLPRVLFLMVLAIFVYTAAFLWTRVTWPKDLAAYIFSGFLRFVRTPQWQRWMLWPTLIFAGLAALFLLPGYFRERKELRLLKWGKPARALVTSISLGRAGNWWDCEYHDAAGNLIKTSSRNPRPHRGELVLTVLYDPAKPKQFIRYPVARYEIAVPKKP